MGIEQFPEIETFQRLPRKVIVKGGSSGFNDLGQPELRGIVINNVGHTIQDIRVFLILFDGHDIPIFNKSTSPDMVHLPQGGIASFTFTLEDYEKEIDNYYLYANWNYDDSKW
jgi:hypothetical protein